MRDYCACATMRARGVRLCALAASSLASSRALAPSEMELELAGVLMVPPSAKAGLSWGSFPGWPYAVARR